MLGYWLLDVMYPWTIPEALAVLPKELGIGAQTAAYIDYYGSRLETTYIQTDIAFQYNSYMGANFYLEFIYYLLAGLIALNFIRRLLGAFVRARLPSPLRRLRTAWIKHFYLSAAVGSQSSGPISLIGARGWLGLATSFQVPLRAHGVLVFLYVAVTFVIMFANYRFAKPDLFWFDLGYPFEKYARGFTDRTGIISLGLTPLVWLLASRNSPLIWMTGVDYSTMQVYHRWVARMAYLNAFCHTLGYSVIEALFGYFFEEFSEAYWNWGWLSYETFLIGHIAGAVVWLVGCYYHVYLLDPHYSYLKYLYGAIAIWGFDRLSRWLMLAYYNLPAVGNAKNGERRKAIFAAEGYLVGEGNYLRLRLQPVRSWPKRFGGPGTYVFLRSVDSSCWQSHPFTLAWPAGMPQPEPRGLSTPSTSGAGSTEKDPSFFKSDSGPVHAFDANAPASTEFELVLKSYAGYTKKLAKQLADSSAVEGEAHALKPVKLLVEGPYGHGTSLNAYDKVLLVAGGSGISATIAHLADLAKGAHFGELNVSEIQIVWAIRDTKAVDVLMPYLARLAPYFHANTRKFLHVHVFYTRETIAPNPSTGVEGIDEEGRELPTAGLDCIEQLCRHSLAFATIDVHAGRPVLSKHVRELLPRGEERTAVSACGPESLCDSTRLAVKGELGGKGGVDSDVLVYHEESFTW